MQQLALVLLVVCWSWCVQAYGNGKVSVACGDMEPQHGYAPSSDPPPYNITVNTSTFTPGDRITVTLRAHPSGSTYFKGFLIEARDAGRPDAPAVGSFALLDPAESRLLRCGDVQGSGVSHRRSSRKTQVQTVWESPKQNPPQRVQFLVTVVQKYTVYWVRIQGPVVSVDGSTPPPATPPTATPPETTSPAAALTTAFSSEGCGSRKSCLRDPVGCQPESDPRCFFLSFSSDAAGGSVTFELSGPADGYVAFALSLDKWMGNDDVYLCVSDGGSVSINAAYVSGRTHPELEEEALWDRAWRLEDGVIQCRFHRNVVLSHMENRFDLNQSYFLFLAHGRAQRGFIHRHDRQPLISTDRKVITGPPEDLIGSRSPLLIKLHGVLMLSAWMWMVSTAVLVARHFRQLTLLGHRVWFQVHRAMMVVAVGVTSVAFILPFIYRGGWSKHAGVHPYAGCTVMALMVIQPIMAALRPAVDAPRRICFNWMHFGTGTIGQILAGVCVFLGVGQQALLLPRPWCPTVLTGWLLWIVLADLLLLIHSGRLRTKGTNSEDRERILFAQAESPRHGEVSTFQKLLLMVFLVGNTGFHFALVKAIASV